MEPSVLRSRLAAAVSVGDSALASADSLCGACVRLLGVDGASISITHAGTTRGTFGSSGPLSRHLDELQFTFGEGPCLDAVASGSAVLIADLAALDDDRWPALRGALGESGVRALLALPIRVASDYVGALDLFRTGVAGLPAELVAGARLAARFAALPLIDLMNAEVNWDDVGNGDRWDDLASLDKVEVYQATGMIMEANGVSSSEALLRLRAFAYSAGRTASEIAWAIVERRISLSGDGWRDEGGG